jgi:hypothetical protein
MDYILFQSQFSPSCKKLLQQFPNLQEKSVSVDNAQMRNYIKKLHIVCVPTLILTMGNKIIERLVGYESIQNWLLITIYRANQISQPIEQPSDSQPIVQNSSQIGLQMNSQLEPQPIKSPESVQPTQSESIHAVSPVPPKPQQTSLEQLILTDDSESIENPIEERSEPLVQMGSGANTMQLAEALKKERDNSFENKKKIAM